MILAGAEGLGKSRFARFLAASLLCDSKETLQGPCGSCKSCSMLQASTHPDLSVLTPEEPGKQLKIDAIRDLVDKSTLRVAEQKYRIFLIEPADAMNRAAANSLLKTLEEPVAGTLLLLVSSHPDKLPATIRSRCQLINFPIPEIEAARRWLMQQTELKPEEADRLLLIARGAPLKALTFHQEGQQSLYENTMNDFLAVAAGKSGPLAIAEKWNGSTQFETVLTDMAGWTIEMVRYNYTHTADTTLNEGLKTLAKRLDLRALYSFLDTLLDIRSKQANNLNNQLALERLLIHWSRTSTKGAN